MEAVLCHRQPPPVDRQEVQMIRFLAGWLISALVTGALYAIWSNIRVSFQHFRLRVWLRVRNPS